MSKATCRIEGCEKSTRARGLCHSHYMEWWRENRTSHRAPCSVEGCDELSSAKGYCPKHYERWRRTGDPSTARPWMQRLDRLPRGHDLSDEALRLRHRSRILIAKYGLTHEAFVALSEAQDGKCVLCDCVPANKTRGDRWLHVDHCHATGRVRGLLCFDCNKSLGRIERLGLDRVVAYLSD